MLRRFTAISSLALSSGLSAQAVDESALDALDKASPVVVQPVKEPAGAVELRAAMRRIAYSPSDPEALADAGNAALMLGDANAALNFFTRANALRPNNGRIVSGLATATVRTENPFEALRLFDDAVRLGVSERAIAGDRALAFDLLGNFARAQQDYRLARSASTSEDLLIRQAISMSLAGERKDADALLVPLLQKDNVAAWRARAFMLAARGDFRESTKVTEGFMDKASAQRMERYLRLMPDLTGAQQAAAIHLGHFPASQYVGRDSDQVRRVASTIPPVEPSKAESRLIPAGDPLGPKTAKADPKKDERKPTRKRDRKAQDREDIRAAVANTPESNKLPKTDRSRLGTESARAAIEQARTARIAAAQGVNLPPPETARPPVTVPVAADKPKLPASQPTPGFSVEYTPARPIEQAAIAVATPSPPPSATAIIDATPSAQATSVPATSAPVTSAPAISAPVTSAPATFQPAPSAPIPSAPSTTASLASDAVTTAQPIQGPTPSGAPVAQTIIASQTATVPVTTTPAPAAATATPVTPAPTPAAPAPAPAFDLAAIVGAIEIPESEQKQSVAAVDLKKLKPTLPKVAPAEATAKNAKVDPKAAAKAKLLAANPARYWVQIATGQASALPFDYNKWTKKSPALFKNQAGWTTPWGKTSRLLVGPFADQKAANKWEGDFKKAGGDSFGWKSEAGEEVTRLKAK